MNGPTIRDVIALRARQALYPSACSGVMALLPDGRYHLAVGSTEMGKGSVTSHRQIAAAVLGSRAEQIDIINADTDLAPFDTGTFASTGTVVAGQAVERTARALRANILDYAGRRTATDPESWRLEGRLCRARRSARLAA